MSEGPDPRTHLDAVRDTLPFWAVDAFPEESVARLNRWLAAQSWQEQEDFLRQTHHLLIGQEEQTALAVARALYPATDALGSLAEIVREAADRGLDQVLDERRAFHTAVDLLDRWLATPTWPEDLDFLRAHPRLAEDPLVRALVEREAFDDRAARQHLGILGLAALMDLPDVYDIVTDLATAVDTAMDFVQGGRPEGLHPLMLAAPALGSVPFVAPFVFAVHLLFAAAQDGERAAASPTPAELIAMAVENGSAVQCGAGASRLRALARHRPEQAAALGELADTLAAASASAPPQDTSVQGEESTPTPP